MNKVSLFASAAVVAAALSAAPVFAQGAGPFADVPTDHWAYQSVDKLQKAGVVIGYPDGTYGGKRAMTRYEFAVAIARLLDIVGKSGDLSNFATKADLAGLATKEEVDQLRQLINEFRTELQTLGVDVDNLKKRMDALEGRVTAIENEMKRVKLSGSINMMARGNHRQGNNTRGIIDQNGYRVTNQIAGPGSLRPRSGAIFADTRVFHDLDLNINARLSETATAEATINFGNYLSFLNNVSSYSGVRSVQFGQTPSQGQEQSIYKLALSAPVRVPGVGAVNLAAGRIPMQLTPYTLKLIDVDAYFYNDKTDLGEIPMDGAKVLFNVGPVGVTAFAAKVDPIKYVSNANGQVTGDPGYGLFAGASRPFSRNVSAAGNGFRGNSVVTTDDFGAPTLTGNRPTQSSIQPNRNGAMSIENIAGARLTFGTGKYGAIGASYIAMSGKPNATLPVFQAGSGFQQTLDDRAVFDRVFVYGADFNGTIAGIGVNIAYNVSDTAGNRGRYTAGVLTGIDTGSKSKINDANEAFDAGLSYTTGALTLGGGYKEIGPYFAAPGYWGRIGAWTNPVDIEGGYVRAGYALGAGLTLSGEGQFYKGTGKDESFGGLRSSDKINNYRAGLKYGVTSASNVDLGIEYTQYKLSSSATGGGGKPEEYFINIGYGYSFNPTTSFKLLYQIVDYKDKNTGFDTQNRKGGIAAAQFSVKF